MLMVTLMFLLNVNITSAAKKKHYFFGAFEKFRKATIRFIMSVRPSAWNDPTPNGRMFMKFHICIFF